MSKMDLKRIEKAMQQAYLATEEAVVIFEESGSRDRELEQNLREIEELAHDAWVRIQNKR